MASRIPACWQAANRWRLLVTALTLTGVWGCNCNGAAGHSTAGTNGAAASGTTTGSGASSGAAATGGSTTGGPTYGQQSTPQTALSDDAGTSVGVVDGPDGGITLGVSVNFTSAFAYVSNSGQQPGSSFVARVDTEQGVQVGRYPSVIPLDNEGVNICQTDAGPCALGSCCLVDLGPTYYDNAASRTVVDLNGGVFVANRGQCDWQSCAADQGNVSYGNNFVQASVTYIANRVDHPEQCAPRCTNRKGWNLPDGGPAIFSSGITLPLADGGEARISPTEVLMPSPGAGDAGTLAAFAPDLVSHPCLDNGPHDPTDVTDPTNYDDCARFTIPLGAPNGYDLPVGLSKGVYTQQTLPYAARGMAISKSCGPGANGAEVCDLYVGLTEPPSQGGFLVHLAATCPMGSEICVDQNFEVVNVIPTQLSNYGLYGAAIDCDGLLWATAQHGGSNGAFVGVDTSDDQVISTWGYIGGQPQSVILAPACDVYGIAVDRQQHVWGGELGPVGACVFDYGAFLADSALRDGGLDEATAMAHLAADFQLISVNGGANTGGLVVDDEGIGYVTAGGANTDAFGVAAVTLEDAGNSACGPNCLWLQTSSTVQTPLGDTWGIDLDQNGNPLITERGDPQSGSAHSGIAGFSATDGTPLSTYGNPDGGFGLIIEGPPGYNDLYTYSDFTGYALRHITQPVGIYTQLFEACPPGNIISWETLSYDASVPSGANISFQLDSANDPSAFSNQSSMGPQILGTWTCASAASCPSPATLTGLGNAAYVRLTAKLNGPACSQTGSPPTLYWVQLTFDCEPPFQ